MAALEDIRMQLGLSQQYLGYLLGVSRAHVNMVERGERQMPVHALKKINQLRKALPPVAALLEESAVWVRKPAAIAQELDDLQYWCGNKARHYKQLAKAMTIKNRQAQNCLAILPLVFKNLPASGDEDEEHIKLILKIIYAESKRQLEEFTPEIIERCLTFSKHFFLLENVVNHK